MKLLALFVVCGFILTPLNADDTGTAGAAFLKLGIGARGMALGEAYHATGKGIEALHWNPARLAMMERPTLMVTHNPLVEGISQNQASLGLKRGRFGFGAGYVGINQDSLDELDRFGNKIGTFEASDQMVLLGLGSAKDVFGFGLTAKFGSSKIDTESASFFSVDLGLGLNNTLQGKLNQSFVVKNMGGKVSFLKQDDPLPLTFLLGNSYQAFKKLLVSVDISSIKGTGTVFAGGLEYGLVSSKKLGIDLRGGYNTQRNEAEDLSGTSFGLGFQFSRIRLDYAWVPYGKLGDTQVVTFRWKIPKIDLKFKPNIRKKGKSGIGKGSKPRPQKAVLILKSGKQLEGTIIEENSRRYRFKMDGRTMNILKRDVIKMIPTKGSSSQNLGDLE